jgi:hypothetical protein
MKSLETPYQGGRHKGSGSSQEPRPISSLANGKSTFGQNQENGRSSPFVSPRNPTPAFDFEGPQTSSNGSLLENLSAPAISDNGKETSASTTTVEASQRDAGTIPGSAGGSTTVEARQRDVGTVPEKSLFGPTTSAGGSTPLFGSSATTAGGSTTMTTRSNIDIGAKEPNQEVSSAVTMEDGEAQEKTPDAASPEKDSSPNNFGDLSMSTANQSKSTIFGNL